MFSKYCHFPFHAINFSLEVLEAVSLYAVVVVVVVVRLRLGGSTEGIDGSDDAGPFAIIVTTDDPPVVIIVINQMRIAAKELPRL